MCSLRPSYVMTHREIIASHAAKLMKRTQGRTHALWTKFLNLTATDMNTLASDVTCRYHMYIQIWPYHFP